jgi:ABC-type transport system involved in cytochrome bd biosynthesis fused ATPase/permease subunit
VGCLVFLLLVLAVAFAGIGFAVHLLWILAAVFFVFWAAGYGFARGQRRAWRRRRY